jgi:hypothetical protein
MQGHAACFPHHAGDPDPEWGAAGGSSGGSLANKYQFQIGVTSNSKFQRKRAKAEKTHHSKALSRHRFVRPGARPLFNENCPKRK